MLRLLSCFLSVVACGTFVLAEPLEAANQPPNLALLVGCTEYPRHPNLRELYGPAHDAPLWASLLTDPKGFAFPKQNVTQLIGWPKETAQRPTYANIVQAFERLIAAAQKDSRVVIVLSGHGIQVPIPTSQKDPLDPKNPEPDGLDEVFLPADVEDWTESKGLTNAITDNQVGAWLDKLRAKGAHVLIVFDCCHSGTMTRGGPNEREINRVADPAALGIKEQAIAHATQRAQQAVSAAKSAGKPIPGSEKIQEQNSGAGSLVAFYAAQPFEEAPELPFPEDAAMVRDNYYGMLSWTLVQTLKSRQGPLTYGELQRLVSVNYRASRGAKPPTPFAEGDLNREVLGLNVWPSRPSLYVERDRQGKLQLQAGELHGITRGSVLAVHPPPGDKREEGTILGYVKAVSVGPSTARVDPVRKVEKPAGVVWEGALETLENIPDSSRCEVIVRDIGDLRVKVFVGDSGVKQTLEKLDARVLDLVRATSTENEADWQLRKVTPAVAKAEYGLSGLNGDRVVLVQSAGAQQKPGGAATANSESANQPRARRAFGVYSLDEKQLQGALERDLPKIFKWESLWRVAGNVGGEGGASHGLALEVVKLKDENDTRGERLRGGVLHDGDEIAFWGQNTGQHDLWASAFYLDANLAIRTVFSGGVGKGKRVKFGQGTMSVEGNSVGLEGLVVIAIPQSIQRDAPNYRMLEQEPLKVADERMRGADDAPPGPFSNLLREAAFHSGTRGWEPRVSTNPAVLSQCWILVPKSATP